MQFLSRSFHFHRASAGLIAAALLTTTVGLTNTEANESKGRFRQILPPNREAFGTNYADLTGKWWEWAVNIPTETNPILDPGGKENANACQVGQFKVADVFFLAGTFGNEEPVTRYCTVPANKPLFFPLLNGLFWVPEDGDTVEEVRRGVNLGSELANGIKLTAEINGRPVEDIFAYRAQSPPGGFTIPFREGGIVTTLFGFDPGDRSPTVADGYWLFLRPLRPGNHEIRFTATRNRDNFELDVIYKLTVVNNYRTQKKRKPSYHRRNNRLRIPKNSPWYRYQ